jgi:tetratricopeptide (TPR) repeat protein
MVMKTPRTLPLLVGLALAAIALALPSVAHPAVTVSEKDVTIPTYLVGDPEPNPMFYFGRNSQGAEGRVYPYPLYDSLTNVKSNKTYRIVYLENEYVRIGVLPEIGGRLFEAVDKSNGYNFVYHQHVIKPALIGLIGAWMSGGLEWNIPHHHRASTFLPVQYRIEENADGSKTVWVGELEIRQRMRWAVGYTLSPGKSYLTATVRIVNRTPLPNTILCFANLAVHVNDNYQVIFPPNTRFVTYHAKREFTTWPIATTRYSGADFSRGVDVSWYTNHFSANSMFAWNYQDDFFAGYDHGKEAGTLSVADHHIVPGKKFWTWGNGPRGRMWDKILTDDDGPYIELMTGAYSDNQPDYSWLQPFETKSFEMHWYPFRDIGGVMNANLDAAVNLEFPTNGIAKIGFCTTADHPRATALLKAGDKILLEQEISISPARPFVKTISTRAGSNEHELRASLIVDGKELIAWSPVQLPAEPMPEPVEAPPAPADIKTVEELYLAGQRIEQFHDPARQPEPYWDEALRRDPGDARVNTSLGIRQLKQAKFAPAEAHFRKALERLTAQYTSPRDGEPFYYLGLALNAQDKQNEAFDAFYKATWSQAWRAPAYFSLAEIATRRGDFAAALDYLDRSLDANALDIRALTLKAAVLRHASRPKDALAVLNIAAQKIDPLDVRLMAERWLDGDKQAAADLTATLRDFPANTLETAAELGNAGLWQDGIAVLTLAVAAAKDKTRVSPMVYYYLAQYSEAAGNPGKASEYRNLATKMSPDYVFPFQWESISPLRRTIQLNPRDARAPYYLGNLLFDWQPEEAVKLWEQSAVLDPSMPIVHRNLALAFSHASPANDINKAIARLETAVSLPAKYPIHFTELDELYAQAGTPPEKRLALLEQNHDTVAKRDDSLSREIGLKVFAGKYDQAIQLMTGRRFAVWEGGRLDVADHWINAHLLRGQQKLAASQFAAALADFEAARTIPDNLPSDRGAGGGRDAEFAYWIGMACDGMGDMDKAKKSWQEAVSTSADTPRIGGRSHGSRGAPVAPPSFSLGERAGVRASLNTQTNSSGMSASQTQRPASAGPLSAPEVGTYAVPQGGIRAAFSGAIPNAPNHRTTDLDSALNRGIQTYYQALALRKLGQADRVDPILRELITSGSAALGQSNDSADAATPALARQSPRSRTADAHYLIGLGYAGLGDKDKAREEFTLALQSSPDHLGAKTALARP